MNENSANLFLDQIASRTLANCSKVRSVYRIGSLAHGGYSKKYSDIDVVLVFAEPPEPNELERLTAVGKEIDAAAAKRLSIFWSDPEFTVGRLPTPDCIDLLDNGRLLAGPEIKFGARPSFASLKQHLMAHSIPYWEEKIRYFRAQNPTDYFTEKEFLRCLLYPARLIYSWTTGKIAGNDEAVHYLKNMRVPGLNLELIVAALDFRNETSADYPKPGSELLMAQREATLTFLREASHAQ